MKIPTWLIAAALVLTFTLSPTASAQKKFNFEGFVTELEAEIPAAEKQAELLLKMLASEKHRARLQADLDTFSESGQLAWKDNYLHRVFSELKAPFPGVPNTLGNRLSFLILLDPNTLVEISRGGTGWEHSPLHLEDDDRRIRPPLADEETARRLAAVCSRIMEIQRPVQVAARQYLHVTFPKHTERFSAGPYVVLLPASNLENEDLYLYFVKNGTLSEELQRLHPVFLKYLRDQADYLNDTGATFHWPDSSLDPLIAAIDAHLSRLAETTDLSDLVSAPDGHVTDDSLPPPPQ